LEKQLKNETVANKYKLLKAIELDNKVIEKGLDPLNLSLA